MIVMLVRGIAYVGMLVPDMEAVAVYYERVLVGLTCCSPGCWCWRSCPSG